MGEQRTLIIPAVRSAGVVTSPASAPIAGTPVAEGTLLAGRWLVLGHLGRGGTSEVFRVLDQKTREEVALKRLSTASTDAKALARLRHERLVTDGIDHPNVLRIHEFAVEDGVAMLTMELLEGQDLRAKTSGRAPPNEVLRWLTHAAAGLGQLHERGWIHGDVKNANLFLTRAGILKLTDFGLSTRGSGSDRLMPGAFSGTPEFMAPEQISGRGALSPATDIYGLGGVAYRLLAGRMPYPQADIARLLAAKVSEDAPPLWMARPDLPRPVSDLVARMLARDPNARPQNTAELRQSLVALWPLVLGLKAA